MSDAARTDSAIGDRSTARNAAHAAKRSRGGLDTSRLGFATRAIRTAQDPEATTGAVVPPLHLATTYVHDAPGEFERGYEYTRAGNPTRDVWQRVVADLEGGRFGLALSSGMAAEDTVLRALLSPGDHVVMGGDVYGGTYRLLEGIWSRWGITHEVVDLTDPGLARERIAASRPRIVWVETPSNPRMAIVDLPATAELAHEVGALLVADNTFASPALQRPLGLGADIVVHSTTKYLSGHSDVLGGAIVVDDEALYERLYNVQFNVGAVLAPFDSWLSLRGARTLDVRMRRHCENAQAVAEFLAAHPQVERVYYPGLPSHPGHELAARQMRGFGGMVSFVVRGGAPAVRAFATATRIFLLAESLGGVESLVCCPNEMSHASVRDTPLEIAPDVVRLSVGIEDSADQLADLERGLAAAARASA